MVNPEITQFWDYFRIGGDPTGTSDLCTARPETQGALNRDELETFCQFHAGPGAGALGRPVAG